MYNWPLQKLREDWALAFSDLISGIVWVTSVSYNWSMVSKATVNQLRLTKITQTIPDTLASNARAQSSRSFWSGQFMLWPWNDNSAFSFRVKRHSATPSRGTETTRLKKREYKTGKWANAVDPSRETVSLLLPWGILHFNHLSSHETHKRLSSSHVRLSQNPELRSEINTGLVKFRVREKLAFS